MSQVTLQGNASGTGIFTLAAPNSNTNRTLNLPDAAGDVVLTTATQTLTNKSISGAQINSGTVAAARLGSGTPGTGNFLRGDGSWQSISVPSTDLDGIGSYAFLIRINANSIGQGATAAGSDLRHSVVLTTFSSLGPNFASALVGDTMFTKPVRRDNNTTYNGGGTALSGTWRKMSFGVTYALAFVGYDAYSLWYPNLYVRIS